MGLAECCHREGVGLVAYSPLAMGLLTVRRVAVLYLWEHGSVWACGGVLLTNSPLSPLSPCAQGKYSQPGPPPAEARLVKYKGRYAEAESRYGPKPNVYAAVEAYVQLAGECGMTPTELALRYDMCFVIIRTTCNVLALYAIQR